MRPVLFSIGSIEIHAWGVMAVLATLAGGLVVRRRLDELAGAGEHAFALAAAALGGGLVGARLYFLAEHAGSVSLTGSLGGSGFTWYGGVIGGAIAVLALAWLRGIPIKPLLGAMGPGLALAYGIARIGCQLAGDGTYGRPSHLPWAMSYRHGEVPTDVRVQPTPIYETIASLAIFALLWRRRDRVAPERLFALYLVLSGVERFLVEFVRRNDQVLWGLTQPQLWAVGLAIGALAWMAATAVPRSAQPAAT